MPTFALLFEAESIQAYITDTGRLKDAVGASSRLDQLCGDLVDVPGHGTSDLLSSVLSVAGAAPKFSRRGGGAFAAFFDDPELRDRVCALWSASLYQYMPGLRFSMAIAEGSNEFDATQSARHRLRMQKNMPTAAIPEAGPLTRRSERTGRAAVNSDRVGGQSGYIDAKTAVYAFRDDASQTHDRITALFHEDPSWHWPRNLEEDFPHSDKNNTEIAVLHADGNGLGIALQSLDQLCKDHPHRYVEVYAGFSRAVTLATRKAAHRATMEVIAPAMQTESDGPFAGCVPARPLVLGGDDLSIIIRPDLAVPFAESFMRAFEKASAEEFSPLRTVIPKLPAKLSAASGIAIVHAKYPFDRALHLAESLCGQAKKSTRVTQGIAPSSLMFYRQTTALLGDWSDIETLETSIHPNGQRYLSQMGPYLLDANAASSQPTLGKLRALVQTITHSSVSKGTLRHLLTELHQTPHTSSASWARFLQVLRDRDAAAHSAFQQALQGLGLPADSGALPFAPDSAAPQTLRTALGDAMTLAHCEHTTN